MRYDEVVLGRRVLWLSLAISVAGCGAAPSPPPRAPLEVAPVARVLLVLPDARLADARVLEPAQPPHSLFDAESLPPLPPPPPPPAPPPRLALDAEALELPAGRSIVEVELPPDRLVSLGVFGAQDALLGFDLVGAEAALAVGSHGALDEDGLLPRIASFVTPPAVEPELVTAIVEATEPVLLRRVAAARVGPERRTASAESSAEAPPLIGLPAPRSREDGYLLGRAGRYEFARIDVALVLMATLQKTRRRFHRDPIVITDISQWDGRRPALDLGSPRHQSHTGGRDVDIGLPASDGGPSSLRLHCKGARAGAEDHHSCVPGSASGVDMNRLAYLLADFVAVPGRVEAIFLDDEYIAAVRRASEQLRAWGFVDPGAVTTLADDRLLRHAPWHTDHVHVRFTGERARVLFPAEPAPAAP